MRTAAPAAAAPRASRPPLAPRLLVPRLLGYLVRRLPGFLVQCRWPALRQKTRSADPAPLRRAHVSPPRQSVLRPAPPAHPPPGLWLASHELPPPWALHPSPPRLLQPWRPQSSPPPAHLRRVPSRISTRRRPPYRPPPAHLRSAPPPTSRPHPLTWRPPAGSPPPARPRHVRPPTSPPHHWTLHPPLASPPAARSMHHPQASPPPFGYPHLAALARPMGQAPAQGPGLVSGRPTPALPEARALPAVAASAEQVSDPESASDRPAVVAACSPGEAGSNARAWPPAGSAQSGMGSPAPAPSQAMREPKARPRSKTPEGAAVVSREFVLVRGSSAGLFRHKHGRFVAIRRQSSPRIQDPRRLSQRATRIVS